jgi:hypothetical protein
MKKAMVYFLLIVVLTGSLHAQFRKIPASVTDTFAVRYPQAAQVEWSDNITGFEAGFKLNNIDMKAGFSSNGDWKYSEKTISFNDLSPEVRDGFTKSKYGDWKTGGVAEILKPGKEPQYRVYAEKSSPFQKKILYFAPNGKLIRDAITF